MTSGITDQPWVPQTTGQPQPHRRGRYIPDGQSVTRRLDELAPLTLIEGSDGTARITLIADWLRRQQEAGTAILCLDAEGGNDPDVFFRRLEASLVQAGIVPRGTGAASVAGLPGTAWLGAAAALDRLLERLIVVIENADHLDSLEVARQLCSLLDVTSSLHIVACSKNAHALSTTASRYRVRTVTVTGDDSRAL